MYTSDLIKKLYSKQCKEQRTKNLIKLREEFANKTQTKFSKETGITKNDLSLLESGDKNLSLTHIHIYKKYFMDNFALNVSADFLMGYTNIIENKALNIGEETGLSNDAIEMLKILTRYRNNQQAFLPSLGTDIDVINTLLEYQYKHTLEIEKTENIPGWSIFHYIKQYLSSGIYEREQQDKLRICDDKVWVDIEKGDTLISNDKSYKIKNMSAINSKSFSGSNPKTVNIVNTEDEKERYSININTMFESYSRDNIFRELGKIKTYIAKKKGRD